MSKTRLEAFSDGVIAIIITIMVLELRPPDSSDLAGLWALHSEFLAYVLSFVFLGIYWNNHHHLLHASTHITGGVLWANLHLLFWLSIVPFVTAWMGHYAYQPIPIAAYGLVLLMDAIALILQNRLITTHGRDSKLARAVERGAKVALAGRLHRGDSARVHLAGRLLLPVRPGCLDVARARQTDRASVAGRPCTLTWSVCNP